MNRGARMLALGFFAIAIAVMPLSGLLSGGVFETWLAGADARPTVHVSLQDETGVVRGLAGVPDESVRLENPNGNRMALRVPILGGCGDFAIRLSFRFEDEGYVLAQRNDAFGCSFLNLVGHGTVLISLWSPVDAATVLFDSPFKLDPPTRAPPEPE